MSKKQEQDFNINFQIRAIEVLNSSLALPTNANMVLGNIAFNINIESKVDAERKLVFVITTINIVAPEQTTALGTICVSCIYEIANFDEIVKVNAENKIVLPNQLVEVLNSISISTTRGVMYATFKGTILHHIILPVLDPKTFSPKETEVLIKE